MGNTLATMITMTTYGTWLRGDRRGWVEDGKLLLPDPILESADRARMKHPPFLFPRDRLLDVGTYIGDSLSNRLELPPLALCVGAWHVHFVVGSTRHAISAIVKCAKDAVRYGLMPYRPIWTDGYDKRFCFDDRTVNARIRYVERHNEALGWPARPWPFLTPYLSPGQ